MSRPTWARWVTRISLILALVALVFTIRDIGLRAIATYFRRIGWWWIAVALLEVVALELPLIRASMRKKSSRVELRRSYANPTPIPPSNLPPYCENLQKRGAPRSVDFSICRPGPPT